MRSRQILTLTTAAAALAALALAPAARGEATKPDPRKEQIARGAYLVKIMVCNDCHTPFKMGPKGPEPDMSRMLSGHPQDLVMPPPPKLGNGPWIAAFAATNTAWAGPWGVSYTANLTPDVGTGLGGWTAKQFADTMRLGKHLGVGREILPPMPIPAYKNFNDADLELIFAYLQSIPAVKNKVPAPLPPAAAASAPAKK